MELEMNKTKFEVVTNNDKELTITESVLSPYLVTSYLTNYQINKSKLLEKFIYKNLETHLLKRMKENIELELELRGE